MTRRKGFRWPTEALANAKVGQQENKNISRRFLDNSRPEHQPYSAVITSSPNLIDCDINGRIYSIFAAIEREKEEEDE